MKLLLGLLRATCCAGLCLAACRDQDRPRAPRPAVTAATDQPALLATVPDVEAPPQSPPAPGLGLHLAQPEGAQEFTFSERGGGVAFVVPRGEDRQVVHNGRAGRPYPAVGAIALSPDGRRSAHGALVDGRWRMVVDGKEGEAYRTVKRPVFSPDGARVAYQAMAGERWHLVVDATASAGTTTRYLQHEFSGDSSRLAFIDDGDDADRGRLVVSDVAFKTQTAVDVGVSSLILNAERSRAAAVSASDQRQRVLTFSLDRPDLVKRGPLHAAVTGLAFGPDGVSLAYAAERSGRGLVVLDDQEEPLAPGEMLVGPLVVRPDRKGVGALVASGAGVRLRQFFADGAPGEAVHEEAEGLVYSDDGRSHAYAARRGAHWLVVVDGKEGPPFDRVVSPLFSPDGRHLVYRARQSGRRFVVVADRKGRTARQHPAHEQVFPVLFTADGKSTAYGVKDGRQLRWTVEAL